MIVTCPNCGKKTKKNAFCPNCGTELIADIVQPEGTKKTKKHESFSLALSA